MTGGGSTHDTMDTSSLAVPRIIDLHGRQRDPYTGNAMEEGQEGPNSIFYVPGLPSETAPDYMLYTGQETAIPFSQSMQKLRDAGFQGSSIFMAVTPRPQDLDRIPSPPPKEEDHNGATVESSFATFYRTKCNYCWAVVQGKERERGFRLEEIKGAADKGCSTCNVLHTSIRNFADMIFPEYSSSKVRIRQSAKERSRLLSETKMVRVCFDEYNGESLVLTFSDEVPNPNPLPPWEKRRVAMEEKRVMETSSYESISQIQQWLQTCSNEHEQCAVPAQSRLPMRVLEISNRRARLIESKGKVAPYVSLSHCWGRRPIIRLLASNIEEMKKDVPWNTLSKTFQDAITVAWKLGFRYIWIDALCILQDSLEDWEYHASIMARIFTDSQLTISASSSSDGSGGCFSSRAKDSWTVHSLGRQVWNPALWLPYTQEGRDREGCVKTFTVRLKIPHGLFQNRQPKEPLLKRAWVFQEQILSARNIHFASGELYFECRSYVACECSGWTARSLSHHWETRWRKSHAVLQGQLHFSLPAAASRERRRDLPKPKPIPKPAAEFEAYCALIETYTCLDITDPHDRLPALSGITSGRKDTYLAGLWKSILLESLHWYPLSRSHSTWSSAMAYRPDRYRAPTWSWASIESPIRFMETNFHFSNFATKPVAQILDASTTPEGLNPRGRVKDGVLKIRAPMVEAIVHELGAREREGSETEEMVKRMAEASPDSLDLSLAPKQSDRDIATYAVLRLPGIENQDGTGGGNGKEKPKMLDVMCYLDLPLCCGRIPPAEVEVGEQVTCLVLSTRICWVLKLVRARHSHYRRVGLFKAKDEILFQWGREPIYVI